MCRFYNLQHNQGTKKFPSPPNSRVLSLCSHIHFPTSNPWHDWSVLHHYSFSSLRMSFKWNHTIYNLLRLVPITIMPLKFIISNFGYTKVCLYTHVLKDNWFSPVWVHCEENCYKYSCTSFFMNINFHFSR